MSTDIKKSLAGRKIGVLGKGGAGKSTAVVLLARALVRAGYTVCIVDADSTNMGLNKALGIAKPPASLIEYFGGMIFGGGLVTCPVDDPTLLPGAELVLQEMPSDYVAQAEPHLYLLTAGKLAQWGAGAGCDGPISKIARDISVRMDNEPLVTLIDFKAGFEDSARGVVTGLDWLIAVVDPTQASLALASDIKHMVEGVGTGQLPATRHLHDPNLIALANRLYQEARLRGALFVLSRIPDESTESFMRRELAAHDIKPIGTIYEDSTVANAWLTGAALPFPSTSSDLEGIISELEQVASSSSTTS
jgi:CO dehydrogenase nickel-insertion accessory protein CooC1